MADPAGDIDRGLAARLRWAALVLGSAMMIVGLACSLAILASKNSGRAPTIFSLFLLQFFQNLGTFSVVYPLGALAVLMFIARACTFWSAGGARAHGVGLPLVESRIQGCATEGRQGCLRRPGGVHGGPQRGDGEEIVEIRAVDIEERLPRSIFDIRGKW